MFVLKSKYKKLEDAHKTLMGEFNALKFQLYDLRVKHVQLQLQWDNLLSAFLSKGWKNNPPPVAQPSSQLSKEDIRRLLMLCHPDKHNGKRMAVDVTAKLTKLLNDQK